jgi:predicted transcriptional regulator
LISKVIILNAIFDRTTSNLFKCIATTHSNSDLLKTHFKLTRKQYYTRMSLLIKAGLVKKEKGIYLVTALGKIISRAQLNLEAKFESAFDNYWKLKAIDSLESFEERNNIISALIDNEEIKSVLLNKGPNTPTEVVNKVGVPDRRDRPSTFNL